MRRATGRPKTSRRERNQRGLTLPEVIVTLFLMSVLSLMFYQLYIGTIQTTMFLESNNDLAAFGQVAVNELKLEVMQSRMLFQNDTLGQAYVSALSFPTGGGLLAGSRLPTINTNGIFEPDAIGDVFTGNCFLHARQLPALEAWVDHDADSSTSDIEYLVDRYRFQFYYLSQDTRRAIPPLTYTLDMLRFRSQVYGDYFQLSGLDATMRAAVGTALYNDGVRFLWDPGKTPSSAFYSLASDGTVSGPVTHSITSSDLESMLPQMEGGRVSGNMTYSVGIQKDPAFQTTDPVSVYAQPSALFPSGLEFQIVGPTGARKILTRLMLMAQYRDKINSHANTVTITTAEY